MTANPFRLPLPLGVGTIVGEVRYGGAVPGNVAGQRERNRPRRDWTCRGFFVDNEGVSLGAVADLTKGLPPGQYANKRVRTRFFHQKRTMRQRTEKNEQSS